MITAVNWTPNGGKSSHGPRVLLVHAIIQWNATIDEFRLEDGNRLDLQADISVIYSVPWKHCKYRSHSGTVIIRDHDSVRSYVKFGFDVCVAIFAIANSVRIGYEISSERKAEPVNLIART